VGAAEMLLARTKSNRLATRIRQALAPAVTAAHSRNEAAELGEVRTFAGYKLAGRHFFVPEASITHSNQTAGKYLEGAPAIAIEVISAEQRSGALARQTQIYFEHGAREVWHVYQRRREMKIYSGSESQARVEEDAVSTTLLPGFALKLRELFGD
jgi:Uma2 family endonuclease